MTFTVITLPQAESEFENQYFYIAERSASGADSWANAFYQALKSLEQNPASCSLAPESEDQAGEIRQILFKTRRGRTYRALFIIRETQVLVLHIRGPGRDFMLQDDVKLPDE